MPRTGCPVGHVMRQIDHPRVRSVEAQVLPMTHRAQYPPFPRKGGRS